MLRNRQTVVGENTTSVNLSTVKSEWTDCHYFVFGSASLLYIGCAGMVRSF